MSIPDILHHHRSGCLKTNCQLGAFVRIVIAKPGLDGHDRGAKVIARVLREGGHDVIYTGLRKRPEEIVRIVSDEDADALGISTLSGAHKTLIPMICDGLREGSLGRVVVFAGGIIPERDRNEIFDSGIRAIFGPGTQSSSILSFLDSIAERKDSGEPVGIGEDSTWHWGE